MANEERIEVYRDHAGEYRWRWIAANGRTMADSGEGYANLEDCVEAAGHVAGANPIVELEEGLTEGG